MMKILLMIALILIVPAVAQALDQPLADPVEEARAVAIGNQLRCVVCQAQSINDSEAAMAEDLRRLVRDQVHAGMSDHQIFDFIRVRYGDFILLNPPLQRNTWLLWLAPVAFLVIAGMGIGLFLRQRPRKY